MSELSTEAQRTVQALSAAMAPPPPTGAAERLASAIAQEEDRGVSNVERLARIGRRLAKHLRWLVGPVIAMAVVVFVARALLRNELGDAAGLHDARMLLEQRDFRGAYKALAEHANEFKSPDSTAARTPLVLDALCGMGKRDDAFAYLERYLALAPDSELVARRDDVCPLGTEPGRRVDDDPTAKRSPAE